MNKYKLISLILFAFVILVIAQISGIETNKKSSPSNIIEIDENALEKQVIPESGVVLPVEWGSLGKQMVENGVIDADKFESIYASRGGLGDNEIELLYGENNGNLVINNENAGVILNLLWAFGLSNKNPILEDGPMQDPRYGGDASRFASTGGWTIAKGSAMDHYSKYSFATLTDKQQEMVERVSKGIFRPCCGNSTYFPDCNHGMAMLGLLELMASQGVGEEEMYKIALQVNSYWFQNTYLTLAKYFASQGIAWSDVDPKEVLSAEYSSASGYRNILAKVESPQSSGGGVNCGVAPSKPQGGVSCGVAPTQPKRSVSCGV